MVLPDIADPADSPGETADERTINLGRRRRQKAADEARDVTPPAGATTAPPNAQLTLPAFDGIAMETWVANVSGRFEFSGMLATACEWHDLMHLDSEVTVVMRCKVGDIKHALGYNKDWEAKAGRKAVSLKGMEITGIFPEGQGPA